MLFPVLTSCRMILMAQTRDEQIASIGMFVTEGDLAPDCRGSMSSRSYCHNHKVIACSFTATTISILTIDICACIFLSFTREQLIQRRSYSKNPFQPVLGSSSLMGEQCEHPVDDCYLEV
jgi:hypothetical protein